MYMNEKKHYITYYFNYISVTLFVKDLKSNKYGKRIRNIIAVNLILLLY